VSYDLGNGVEEEGLIVGLFNKITTMDRASYVVRYTAIVESVLGDVSVKCVITNAQIIKDASIPAWQYRKQATSLLLKEVGQTRVLQLDEFNLK